MFASLAPTPTRQQGAWENWKPSARRFRKLKAAVFLQPLKHNARKEFSLFSFFFHRLPILHLPFPSRPCGHKGSCISVNRIKSSIDPQATQSFKTTPPPFPFGLNKASKLLNLVVAGTTHPGSPPWFPLPPPVRPVPTTWGAAAGSEAVLPKTWKSGWIWNLTLICFWRWRFSVQVDAVTHPSRLFYSF